MTELYKQIGKTLFCKDCAAFAPREYCCRFAPRPRLADATRSSDVWADALFPVVSRYNFCFDLIPKEEK